MAPLLASSFAAVALVITVARVASAAPTTYVAPSPTLGLSSTNQEYLIGVVSFFVVVVAAIMGIASMVKIDYDDDTLLMVEVPADLRQDKD
ncbi:hypothetical protein LSCM1_06251 [Leishmania martiniquensis]|uniref:Transmembrane protein n=1 Tax=Leishmania martiniquensis TaxID=1580590 RepID=A0A836KPC8_9TRYP|nr:hypothetical protein LSCM1_06251 [Leishmania martiniquensis]